MEQPTHEAMIAKKREEVAAKMAAMKAKFSGVAAAAKASVPPVTSSGSATPAKIAAPVPVKPQTTAPAATRSGSASESASPSPGPASAEDLARRVAEARRRVAEAQSKLAVKDNPYLSMPQAGKSKSRPAEPSQQGAGLKMAAHPLLLDATPAQPQSKKDKYKPMQPKFASIKANIRTAPTPPPVVPSPSIENTLNPYASASSSKDNAGSFEGAAPRERNNRQFRFNPLGKYVSMGNKMRSDIQLEALKQRIAEGAKKAGLDSEFETLEKNTRRPAPPEAEWWDVALLPHKTYDDLAFGIENLNINTPDSPITIYIQHPIPIPAPDDKNKATLKPLMLTKKEQKKMRKQRRATELQDKRDRIRMGLIPPDAPKVRLSNLMKVLTSDAVQDPTRVEARVRREVAMRKHGHEKMNAERKLTDEQRREKKEEKKLEEEKKGIWGAVFKIKTLSDPAHRFKVKRNAEQMNLTGVCIFNPTFALVYVEGAHKFIRNYKRLMLHRIVWTQAARLRGADEVEVNMDVDGETNGDGEAEDSGAPDGPSGAAGVPDGNNEEEGAPQLDDNSCHIVWEGQLRDRSFSAFKPKSCPTDTLAKEVLGEKLRGYWDLAKNLKPEEEELY
jgi:U4/U6 small nuclear ribonucleoprotein PRP3